jgi:Glutamine synthetase, catalytic domain
VSSSEERTARSFVERHVLWNDEQFEAAANADKWIEEHGLAGAAPAEKPRGGALRNDNCLADGFGRNFIDYYLRIKDAEIARYQSEVTEWEQREYFELF